MKNVLFVLPLVGLLSAGCIGAPSEGDVDRPVDDASSALAASTSSPNLLPMLPCGSSGQYENVPLALNDGSGTVVPTGGIVPAGGGATFPIQAPAGATLTSIVVRIDPATHTSLSGQGLPYLELHRVGRNGVVSTVGSIAWDPYYNGSSSNGDPTVASAFSQVHDITMTLNHVVTDSYYYVTFAQEWGGGQSQNGVVCGSIVTFSACGF